MSFIYNELMKNELMKNNMKRLKSLND